MKINIYEKSAKNFTSWISWNGCCFNTGIINLIPPDFHWYVFQHNLINFIFLMTGGIQILIWQFISVFILPSEYLDYIHVSIGAIIGFALGILIYLLWVKHWFGKTVVICLLLLNTVFSGFVLFLNGFIFVTPAVEVCQISIADDIKIRVIGYASILNSGYYGHYFVLPTVDDGQTWKQVIGQSYDTWDAYPPPPDCEGKELHFGEIGDHFIWIWTNKNLSVSHDGGQSWQNWQPSCRVREDCDYGDILSVTFDDPHNGRMRVYLPPGKSKEIISSDGGLTWHSQDK